MPQKKRDRKKGFFFIKEKKRMKSDGMNAILVDDMISTGGSIVKACEVLQKQKIANITVLCTHAILVDNAFEKIINSGVKEIISTNSVPSICSKVDLSIVLSNILVNAN